jgi:hypothetical protein
MAVRRTAQLVTPRRYDADRPVRVDLDFRILEEPAYRGGIFGVACLLTGNEETAHGYAAVVQASDGQAYYGLLDWEGTELVGIVPLDAPAEAFDYDGERACCRSAAARPTGRSSSSCG